MGAYLMKYFMKLNVISILYAIMVFIPIELMVNVYRISRLTKWEIDTVKNLTGITLIVEIIGGTILILFLTKKWLEGRKSKFWTVILWVPYWILFIIVFAFLFPITNAGDKPNPATGLLVIGGLIIYPLYTLTLNFIVDMTSNDETVKTP